MPNLASLLKSEISRLARKEIRTEIESLKKASSAFRSEIAALKKQVRDLQAEQRRLARASKPVAASAPPAEPSFRFRPDGMKSHREKLGLSAKDYGLLIGASGLSVYKWEGGKAKPRDKALSRIAEAGQLGKREAAQRLEALRAA